MKFAMWMVLVLVAGACCSFDNFQKCTPTQQVDLLAGDQRGVQAAIDAKWETFNAQYETTWAPNVVKWHAILDALAKDQKLGQAARELRLEVTEIETDPDERKTSYARLQSRLDALKQAAASAGS